MKEKNEEKTIDWEQKYYDLLYKYKKLEKELNDCETLIEYTKSGIVISKIRKMIINDIEKYFKK